MFRVLLLVVIMGCVSAFFTPMTIRASRAPLMKVEDRSVPRQGEFDNFARSYPVLQKNRNDDAFVSQRIRPRRNRKNAAVRGMVRENVVTPKDFIYPLFIWDGDHKEEISSMPDCFRHTMDTMLEEIGEAMSYGVGTFILFPKVPDELKTNYAEEAYNPEGIVPRALRLIKAKYPDAVLCTGEYLIFGEL